MLRPKEKAVFDNREKLRKKKTSTGGVCVPHRGGSAVVVVVEVVDEAHAHVVCLFFIREGVWGVDRAASGGKIFFFLLLGKSL